MRRSHIWFLLAVFWGIDCALALHRHNRQQVALAGLFSCCFLVLGIVFRMREQRTTRRLKQNR